MKLTLKDKLLLLLALLLIVVDSYVNGSIIIQ
jgi:hypothetical protein